MMPQGLPATKEYTMTTPVSQTRRQFVRKAAYVAPAILTLQATPAFAKSGSGKPKKRKEPKP